MVGADTNVRIYSGLGPRKKKGISVIALTPTELVGTAEIPKSHGSAFMLVISFCDCSVTGCVCAENTI